MHFGTWYASGNGYTFKNRPVSLASPEYFFDPKIALSSDALVPSGDETASTTDVFPFDVFVDRMPIRFISTLEISHTSRTRSRSCFGLHGKPQVDLLVNGAMAKVTARTGLPHICVEFMLHALLFASGNYGSFYVVAFFKFPF